MTYGYGNFGNQMSRHKPDEAGGRIPVTTIHGSVLVMKVHDGETYKVFSRFRNIKISPKQKWTHKESGLLRSSVFTEFLVRVFDTDKPGAEIMVEMYLRRETTTVSRSKGKGFAGVVKRHHFMGGPRTHGQSDRERLLGQSPDDNSRRVYRGTHGRPLALTR
jgi:large subunit ribosomal protein L3